MTSFLDLAIELRYYVYEYMAMEIPISVPFTAYLGLYLSCHQIKSEIDSECPPIMHAHITALQDSIQSAYLTIPSSFLTRQHLHVCHIRQLDSPDILFPSFGYNHLLPLCKLHLATLAMVSARDVDGSRTIALLYWVISRILREEVNVRRIVVHMPIVGKSRADDFRHTVLTPEGVEAVWQVEGSGGCGKQDERVMRVLQGALTGSGDVGMPPGTYPLEHSSATGN
ncbi:hypothetical protein HBI26_081940 [Parastagonospora nodorum]|nr:hypothetical protein HBI26_081940 [Parastagonospora nodorum]